MISIERNYLDSSQYASSSVDFKFIKVFKEDESTSHCFVGNEKVDAWDQLWYYLNYYSIINGTVTYNSSIRWTSPTDLSNIVCNVGTDYYYVSTAGRIMCATISGGSLAWANTSCYVSSGRYFKQMHINRSDARLYAVTLYGTNWYIYTFSFSGTTLVLKGTTLLGSANIVVNHIESANTNGSYFWMSYKDIVASTCTIASILAGTTGISFVSGGTINLSYATDTDVYQFATNLDEGSPATRLYFGHGSSFYIYSVNGSYQPSIKATHSIGNVYKTIKLKDHVGITLHTSNKLVVYKLIGDGGIRNDTANYSEYYGLIDSFNIIGIASARYNNQIACFMKVTASPPTIPYDTYDMRVLDVKTLIGTSAQFI